MPAALGRTPATYAAANPHHAHRLVAPEGNTGHVDYLVERYGEGDAHRKANEGQLSFDTDKVN